MNSKINQSWGGRFNEPMDKLVEIFNSSIAFDKVLAPYDIKGSIAHATMLFEVGVISSYDKKQIINGLEQILNEINTNKFKFSIKFEDIHMNIEKRLIEICGNSGKKLHTGRSRNDQVATDMRLYLCEQVNIIIDKIRLLQKALVDLADKEKATIMPGFTHLQAAQIISLGHHLMAYFAMLERDVERMQDCYKRINTMPLGAAALAGTSYPIDQKLTAKLLNFARICDNSIDAVSDRDFVIEFISASSLIAMHLSRLAEEIIIWSSAQFDFITIADSFCSGSSIMPQKKNPDVAELIRAKTGRINGNLISLLTIMKAQPLAYNKDNQEDKEPLFDTVETIKNCLQIFAYMLPNIKIKRNNMLNSSKKGYTTATDLADYLVKKNISFRDAHKIVGKLVAYAIKKTKNLDELTLDELQHFHKAINKDVFLTVSIQGSLNSRDHFGSSSIKQIKKSISRARKILK